VAQKLHDQYQYSYDNLKVLLGGWSAWQSAGYPTETSGTTAPGDGSAPSEPITKNIVITP
jgi:3-mercaptopyruvate sulfurtransferase SseA